MPRAQSLTEAGISKKKICTHFAGVNDAAFNDYSQPGFTAYTTGFKIDPILEERDKSSWCMSEGTNLDEELFGVSMEAYLAERFNHKARLVNIFAWHQGQSTSYGRATTSDGAKAAYRKFLSGDPLSEDLN